VMHYSSVRHINILTMLAEKITLWNNYEEMPMAEIA